MKTLKLNICSSIAAVFKSHLHGSCSHCVELNKCRMANLHNWNLACVYRGFVTQGSSQAEPVLPNERKVGITPSEQTKLTNQTPLQPADPRMLKIAIIGPPNAGKSTLANQLLGWRFSAVSKKVHTTRNKSIGVLTEGNTQVVFLDTPGLTNSLKVKKHNLERTLLTDPHSSLFEADLIMAVVDVSKVWNRSRLDSDVLTALALHADKRSLLVLNKVDLLKTKADLLTTTRLLTDGRIGGKDIRHETNERKPVTYEELSQNMDRKLGRQSDIDACDDSTSDDEEDDPRSEADGVVTGPTMSEDVVSEDNKWWKEYNKRLRRVRRLTENDRGWKNFERVFMVSAVDGNGVEDIKDYLIECAPPAHWEYHSSLVTDQDPREMARMCVWEKLLDHLPDEVPYQITVKVSMWVIDEENVLRAIVDLICTRKRHTIHLFSNHGATLRKISMEAKQDLMNTFQTEMTLQLNVKTLPKSKPR